MIAPTSVLLNGIALNDALASSRGLHYGDGVFRTLLKFRGRLVDLEAQIVKLSDDAARLGLNLPDTRSLRDEIEQAGEGAADAVIKVLLTRAGTGRGYRPRSDAVDRLVLRYPLPSFEARCWDEGIAAIRSPVMMATQPLLAGVKHLNRLEQVLASRGWPDGIDEAILCDQFGAPVCGTRSNLFWIARGVLHTAELDQCGVAGLMRDRILMHAIGAGMEVRIESQPWSALISADEVFISNSLVGVWPLRQLDDAVWSAPGLLTRDLMQRLDHPKLCPR